MLSKIELFQSIKKILKILILASFLFDEYSFYYEYATNESDQIKHHESMMKHHVLSIPYLKDLLGHVNAIQVTNNENLDKFVSFYYCVVIYDLTIFLVNSMLVFSDSYLSCGLSLFDTLIKICTKINFIFFLRNKALFLNVIFSLLLLCCFLFQSFNNWNFKISEKDSESDISDLTINLEKRQAKEKRSRRSGTPFRRSIKLESKF